MDNLKNIISDAILNGAEYTGNIVKDVKKHYVLSELLGIPISGYSSFTLRNKFYRDRLLNINIGQKTEILNSLGEGVIKSLGETSEIDYNNEFASIISKDEKDGYDSTSKNIQTGNNYSTNNPLNGTVPGSIYTGITNLYHDDNGTGTFSNKIEYKNADSILNKTKKLFNKQKINTIISRFYTDTDSIKNGDIVSSYGMSHGRNLLKKEAENGNPTGKNFIINGYSNPYCRVWTHHYQYDNISKLIRPFSDGNGNFYSVSDLQGDWSFIRSKDGVSRLDKYGSLNKNGFVNIAPSYDAEKEYKIDTKKCMFSIENLAWKGYDPYSFEKALSWEQRGPFGGRIMWFPPYNLTFQEDVSVKWNSDTFIGRGENVYTYSNTERSGTLTFQMVVDHPSIINYYEGGIIYDQVERTDTVNGNETGFNMAGIPNIGSDVNSVTRIDLNNIKSSLPSSKTENTNKKVYESVDSGKREDKLDTDLLRFFAGCSTIDGTHKNLTDEFTSENEIETTENKIIKTPTPVVSEDVPNKVGSFSFYVFFPNNYSGIGDLNGENVNAIAYLLNGYNAQKHTTSDVPISYYDFYNNGFTDGIGIGYETCNSSNGISDTASTESDYLYNDEYSYIIGTTPQKNKWYYRIDGSYDTKSNNKNNFYNQQLKYNKNYSDNKSYGLNGDSEQVKSLFNESGDIYSLADVAYALTENETARSIIKTKIKNQDTTNAEKIIDIVSNGNITNISIYSFSNSHGNNAVSSVNNTRNDNLAKNRGLSVKDWLMSTNALKNYNSEIKLDYTPSQSINTDDISNIESKKYRSAIVRIDYEMSNSSKLAETKQQYDDNGVTVEPIQEYIGYNSSINSDGEVIYTDENGKKWKKDNDGNLYMIEYEDIVTGTVDVSIEKEFNDIRYDQEYRFFTVLKKENPIVFNKLIDKIKYFDPAFHSMTPEGFNGRLNFLHQCTRQGNTIGSSDTTSKTATNLSFGRPPICVLRLGDFYYTEIVITNMSYQYDPLVWDLNPEGIGVQPLLATITLSFNFIGGSDLAGPIKRLQNAMTFNYYANTGVYDNRADTVTYSDDDNHTGNVQEYKKYNAYIAKQK